MQYLCLIYSDEKLAAQRSEADMQAYIGEYKTFTQDIAKSGHLVAGEALQPVSAATTVRTRNGETTLTDGPFAETKEQLGGYYLIEAKDLDDAIAVAKRIPTVRHGAIEVRPIMKF